MTNLDLLINIKMNQKKRGKNYLYIKHKFIIIVKQIYQQRKN